MAVAALCTLSVLTGCDSRRDERQPLSAAERAPCLNDPDRCATAGGVFPLSGYAPDAPDSELGPVREALAGAEVIGLGESAHASAGFIGLKVRLSRYLIERAGFRVVTWESSRVPARKLNDYVQTCTGDPAEAVKSLYEIWADVLTRDFAQWLCRWNQAHPDDRVQVHGFDVQDPASDRAELEQFLSQTLPGQAAKLLGDLAACERRQHQACRAATHAIRARLEGNAARLASAASPEALATARIALTSYAAWQDEVMIPDNAGSFEARDIGMASVFQQLRALHFPGQKALLWAHNIHIVKRHEKVNDSWVGGPIVTQGTELHRQLGDRYRAVAIIGFDVWLNRPEQSGHVVPSPTSRSLEAMLHELGEPALFIDLRHSDIDALLPVGQVVELGAPGVETHVPRENYDAILYLDESPMADVL